jgi:3-methyladenine DNA glycosylase AlkD
LEFGRAKTMSAKAILEELRSLGSDSYKRVLVNHGAREPFFGVKIEYLKKIQKRIKKDYQLALDLFDTGVSDAMYLAGLIADSERMTKKDLQHWSEKAYFPLLSEYTVAWVASESPHGRDLGLKWIESRHENIASSGWSTLSSLVSITKDEDLDLSELRQLLARTVRTIREQPNRVRYCMNGFVIAVGSFVSPLTAEAIAAANKIGPVAVDMNGTACKVPSAVDYIKKVQKRGSIGKKRKTAMC